MATTQKEIGAGEDLEQLKALVAEQQHRLDALEGNAVSPPNGGDSKDKRSTRRQLLKLAGATLAGAAGSAALRAIPASAADGNTVTVGSVFGEQTGAATAVSSLAYITTSSLPFGVLGGWAHAGYGVYGYTATTGQAVRGRAPGGGTAVFATASGGGGIGLHADGTQYGGMFSAPAGVVTVLASSASGSTGELGAGITGVAGRSTAGTGVYGFTSSTNSHAVYGYTSATGSPALHGHSINSYGAKLTGRTGLLATSTGLGYPGAVAIGGNGGPDLLLNGYGRLVQYWYGYGGTFGGPNFTPAPNFFETVRNRDGAMWQSRGNGTGAVGQAAWKRVNAVRTDSADGTGKSFKPFRVIDTRTGGTKRAKGSMNGVAVAGLGTGLSAIPSDAVAVIGNLTATGYTGGGFLAIMPFGIAIGTGAGQYNPAKDPSSLNFQVGQTAIANSFVCGLSSGALQVYVGGTASHFIVDITGYMQ